MPGVVQVGRIAVELTAGTMLYLTAAQPHALHAVEDSSLLVFISLRKKVLSKA